MGDYAERDGQDMSEYGSLRALNESLQAEVAHLTELLEETEGGSRVNALAVLDLIERNKELEKAAGATLVDRVIEHSPLVGFPAQMAALEAKICELEAQLDFERAATIKEKHNRNR